MNKNIIFLPKYTVSQLTDRVALKLDYFNKLFNSDNLFEGIGEPCLMVESEPRSISTLILEAKKDNKIMFNVSNLAKYNFKLTLIYIILYYRHRDDALYQTLVFPDLRKNMGFYGKEEILKQKINQEIDKILEFDKLVEQSKEKKNVLLCVINYREDFFHIIGISYLYVPNISYLCSRISNNCNNGQ